MSNQTKQQKLLTKLYECQEEMESMLKNGKEDPDYKMICELIKRLELSLCYSQDLM